MKKLLSLSILLIASCITLTGCKDSIKEDESKNNIEEQIGNYTDIDDEEQIINNIDIDNEKNYTEINVSDLATIVESFSYGKGWYLDNSSEQWTCIDTEGNILFSLPSEWRPKGGFVQNLCLAEREGYKDILFDESGNPVLTDLATGDNTILALSETNGVINIWVRTVTDTYDGHYELLRMIDENGVTLNEYEQIEGHKFSSIDYIKNLGDGMYCAVYAFKSGGTTSYSYSDYIFNTNTDSYFYSPSVINFENGYSLTSDGKLIDTTGTTVFLAPSYKFGYTNIGSYHDGVFFAGSAEREYGVSNVYSTYNGVFFNSKGEVELDISQYRLTEIPYFNEGYCVLKILNEGNIQFTTVMDRNGNFLFEPIEGFVRISLSDGIAVANIRASDRKWNLTKIYDLAQNTVNEMKSDEGCYIGEFHDGWASYGTDIGCANSFIDKNGNFLKVKVPLD